MLRESELEQDPGIKLPLSKGKLECSVFSVLFHTAFQVWSDLQLILE